jgi:putative membrane-bound dehydrogenase-like protein
MMNSRTLGLTLACPILTMCLAGSIADTKPGMPPAGPLSPRDEQATFRTLKGFKVELVAHEPQVVDPVAMAFDENGRLFVAEMIGYPNEGVATGFIASGRIRLLEDRDGDGFYEKATIFADKLRFPTSVMPWKGGLLVSNAPELIYLQDKDGDGKSDKQRVLYTGFDLKNIQQLLNGLQWGLDNWIYGCAGNAGGVVKSAEKPELPAVTLRSRGIRFRPDVPGSLEPTSGGGQYGLAADDWGQWFTATNSQHLRHIVLPDHYLRRNPFLPVSAVTLDIPDHGPACKVHRISPFEAWRVERTTRRKDGADSKRFSPTELVPGGFITSACSPVVYTADLFPAAFHGNVFVCDPANNLIHRDILEPNGATFVAKRGDADCEFLASTDNWFRPTCLTIGPDGALYVLDFYREVIETPLSLPDDIKKKLNLESRGRGRIWRIAPEGKHKVIRPELGKASTSDLVRHLAHPNPWWRMTAQRLLIERRQELPEVNVLQLILQAHDPRSPVGRAHSLWTLHGLGMLKDRHVLTALSDQDAGVRQQALRLAEERLSKSSTLREAVVKMTGDPSPRVRFQLAFTLGASDAPEVVAALAKVARHAVDDPKWLQIAVLSSATKTAAPLLHELAGDKDFTERGGTGHRQLLTRLAALVGAQGHDAELARALSLLSKKSTSEAAGWRVAVIEGLGQGLQNSKVSLARLWDNPPPALKDAVAGTRKLFDDAARAARDDKRDVADRTAAVRLLGYGPFVIAEPPLKELLSPRHGGEVQLAAVRALSLHDHAKVGDLLLASWSSYSPTVRREVLEAVFARTERVRQLLTAIEKKKVLAGQLEPSRLVQLRKHPDAKIRQQAQKLLAGQIAPDRQKIVAGYQPALDLKGDSARGKVLFKKTCATCHRLENEGTEVGPELAPILRSKTPETLLVDILDPSREVDPRFIEYAVTTTNGRNLTGMIAAETASSVTLRRAENAEDTLLRSQIESILAAAKSLMPEGLEMQLNRQDVADVIAYLLTAGSGK